MMGILYMLVAGVNRPQNRRHIPQPARKETDENCTLFPSKCRSQAQCAMIPLELFGESPNRSSGATTGKLPRLSKFRQTFGPVGNMSRVTPLSFSAASKRSLVFFNTTSHLLR